MSLELKLKLAHGNFELDIDQVFASQGVTAIYGPSGSGKTSVLRAIAGLDKSASGLIKFNNRIWQNGSEFIATHQRALAYVFQEPSLFEHMSVRANVEYGFNRVPPKQRIISSDEAIQALGICGLLDRDTQTLSGGEKQRVAIARALCSSPDLLLMDEPLSALDKRSKTEILPMLVALRDKLSMPIIYVSHSLNEVARLADHLVLMEQGRVIASGDIQSMLTQLDLSLAKDVDAESLVDAIVVAHDEQFELTYLDSSVGRFSVLRRPLAVGEKVRLLIAARDVSITRQQQQDTSILNIFPAIIEQIESVGTAQVTVRLKANNLPILARLTRKSAALMNLAVGDSVYLQAKSVAIL